MGEPEVVGYFVVVVRRKRQCVARQEVVQLTEISGNDYSKLMS